MQIHVNLALWKAPAKAPRVHSLRDGPGAPILPPHSRSRAMLPKTVAGPRELLPVLVQRDGARPRVQTWVGAIGRHCFPPLEKGRPRGDFTAVLCSRRSPQHIHSTNKAKLCHQHSRWVLKLLRANRGKKISGSNINIIGDSSPSCH